MTDGPSFRLTERFDHAVGYANRIHANQTRKGTGIPYLTHLLGVASLVLENGAESEDEVIGALLHDAAEDQGGRARLEDIREQFGESVGHIVDACTDSYEDPKPPWRGRKEAYVERVRERVGRGEDEPALRVSLADKLHNTRAILADVREGGPEVFDRFNGKRDGTLWYYAALVDAFRGFPNRMVGELDRTVADLRRLARNRQDA
ncbi:MAG TPA: HD domain-containing protein [Actinomycetota bacterium]|nr:HD domain-containing protein [Actinomycetota bacterium]